MKKTPLYFLFPFLLAGCATDAMQHQPTQRDTQQIAVRHLIDRSKSCDYAVSYFDSNAARGLYDRVASRGGSITCISVLENSANQSVLTIPVARLDTETTTSTNVYQVARQKAKNAKLLTAYQVQARENIARYIEYVNQPRTERYSDLNNSLSLARLSLMQSTIAHGFRKYLVISSDLQHQVPTKDNAVLQAVHLPDITVICIRPSLPEDSVRMLFPDSEVLLFSEAAEAIQAIR